MPVTVGNACSLGSIESVTTKFRAERGHVPLFTQSLHVVNVSGNIAVVKSIESCVRVLHPLKCLPGNILMAASNCRNPRRQNRGLTHIGNTHTHVRNDLGDCLCAGAPRIKHPSATDGHGLVHELGCKSRWVILYSLCH